jgi:hypothetical protein
MPPACSGDGYARCYPSGQREAPPGKPGASPSKARAASTSQGYSGSHAHLWRKRPGVWEARPAHRNPSPTIGCHRYSPPSRSGPRRKHRGADATTLAQTAFFVKDRPRPVDFRVIGDAAQNAAPVAARRFDQQGHAGNRTCLARGRPPIRFAALQLAIAHVVDSVHGSAFPFTPVFRRRSVSNDSWSGSASRFCSENAKCRARRWPSPTNRCRAVPSTSRST